MKLVMSSPAFEHGHPIPSRYSCEGDDISPPLEWSGIPEGTKSLALIVDDPDAPKRAWTHWLLYDMPPDVTSLAEGLGGDDLPPGAREGLNDWKRVGWGGPCPPTGRHRYSFRLYALDESLGDLHRPMKAKLEKAIEGHVIAMAEMVGTYEKRGG